MKKRIIILISLASIWPSATIVASDLYVAGYVYATNYITSATTVTANTYFYTPGYLTALGAVNAGSYFYSASGYLSVGGTVYSGTVVQAPSAIFGGTGTNATGTNSSALGFAATAPSYSAVTIGRYNVPAATAASDGTAVTAGSWVDKDPLFVVGNGNGTTSDPNQYRNALTVYKDGTITMSKAQGDISMGSFGN